jgi:hypothetical protein
MDLEIPVDDPEPFHTLFQAWFFWRVTEALKRWAPVFDGIVETEAVSNARTGVQSRSRAVRRKAQREQSIDETEYREGKEILSNHPLTNNRFSAPDEWALRQDTREAVRRAMDDVIKRYPQAKGYFDKLESGENVTKKEIALTIGRDPSGPSLPARVKISSGAPRHPIRTP